MRGGTGGGETGQRSGDCGVAQTTQCPADGISHLGAGTRIQGARMKAADGVAEQAKSGGPPRHPSVASSEFQRQWRGSLERKCAPGELVGESRLERMQEQALRFVRLREFPVQREVAVGLVADDRQLALGALHAELVT